MTIVQQKVEEIQSVEVGKPEARRRGDVILAGLVVFLPLLGFLAAISLLFTPYGAGLPEILTAAVFYVLTLYGVELGFHRYFSHHAYRAGRVVDTALVLLGSMAAQGPVLFWAAMHRRHHARSDLDGDPHSPIMYRGREQGFIEGLLHAHMGWLFSPDKTDWVKFVPDLLRDRYLFSLNSLYFFWLFLGLLLPALICWALNPGWQSALNGFLWGGLARIFMVHNVVWSLNSICHRFGTKDFEAGDQSRNNILLAPFTLGASWHNNHHAFQKSANIGFRWWQIDLHYEALRILKVVGLVRDLHLPSPEALEARDLRN